MFADISVSELSVTSSSGSGALGCQYRARLRFFPQDRIPAVAEITFAELEATFRQSFIPALQVRLTLHAQSEGRHKECPNVQWGVCLVLIVAILDRLDCVTISHQC